MGKKKSKESYQSVYDMVVESAEKTGDADLIADAREQRDEKKLQRLRAEKVFAALTSGLPDRPTEDDGIDYLDWFIDRQKKTIADNLDLDSIYEFLMLCGVYIADLRSTLKAVDMSNALHDKPGGSRARQGAIRAAWATGKFASRTRCAEEECAGLGMSYEAARRALRNTPDPIRDSNKEA